MDSSLTIAKIPPNKLWGNGSGVDYALGADFVSLKTQPTMSASDRVRLATEAAIENDNTCPGSAVVFQF